MTAIDETKFRDAYLAAHGTAWTRPAPPTLAAMFDALHDPDELDARTTATLHAARGSVDRVPTMLTGPNVFVPRVTVFPGDLHVEGNLTIDSHVLVLGDLVVDGVVTANPAHAILMVAGDVRCRATHLVRAYLFVTGDVACEQCFFGCLYGFAKVGGTIRTKLYLHDGSWGTFADIEANVVLDVEKEEARAMLDALLLPLTLDPEAKGFGDEELHGLLAKIALGARVLRE